ncbi:putative multiple sugar transport system substrate-binding protein [Spinactinospora alkalitolerans]|uniref:Putative multiple sugar transport system substrate-binding protein n=1 Tax=Spinactinospora alkalitolerans TaxID=687207 RepID=A0A852TZ00_9ACTN|nr:multiple monosaccharide ABC transporter substrate-binding protein [Spinactinospora alkalitolerans]NYE49031.1 putative multiple sugar transport system substrate-binding protein [Spinactinospora alkalitolerans]
MRRLLHAALAAVLLLPLAACNGVGAAARAEDRPLIGVAMPTKSKERWVDDGSNMAGRFRDLGYDVDLQYAQDELETQISQIENMITKGADALVIASINGEVLTEVTRQAADQGIPVIAYDRLIMGTEHVDYYATFDNFKVGELQGGYLEQELGLDEGEGPFNIELFGGSPDDNNAYFFYDGAMSVLQPYIDSGQLVVRSGQTEMNQIATMGWDGSTAQARMDNLLSAHYQGEPLHAVLAPADSLSLGVISSLKSAGYGSQSKPMPVITGQDADISSVKSIIADDQTMTIFKDTRELADVAVNMADALIHGREVEVNDTESYDNGERVVPSQLLEPVVVDQDNYEETLVDSGYYTEAEVAG